MCLDEYVVKKLVFHLNVAVGHLESASWKLDALNKHELKEKVKKAIELIKEVLKVIE